MDEKTAKEIQQLKEDVYQKREEIRDIKKLINREIDREFFTEVWELSEREYSSFVREYKPSKAKFPDLKVEPSSVTSHRKIIGWPIVFVKRILLKMMSAYINENFDKQMSINRQIEASYNALYEALLRRFMEDNKKIRELRGRIENCEESLSIILNKLDSLSPRSPEDL